MKKLVRCGTQLFQFDPEEDTIESLQSSREAISRIYLVREDCELEGQTVKKNDIIVTFYEADFDKKVIVVRNKDWKNNILGYEKKLQEEKEKWALEKESECCKNSCKNICASVDEAG